MSKTQPQRPELSPEDRARLMDMIRDKVDPEIIPTLIPGVAIAHVRRAALDLVASIDAGLATVEAGPPQDAPTLAGHARRECERRDAMLRYAGSPQSRDVARRHLLEWTLRILAGSAPLGKLAD